MEYAVHLVPTEELEIESYVNIVSGGLLTEIARAAESLQGMRVAHVNATPVGGGVAEILKSLVPLMKGVGIDAEWYTIAPEESFFRVSKALHHSLQGGCVDLRREDIELYLAHNQRTAKAMAEMGVKADLWVCHDVQVLPLFHYIRNGSFGVWICHVDTTEPDKAATEILSPYINEYHSMVCSMPNYHLNGYNPARILVFPPAIDPLSPKNVALPRYRARELLAGLGIDPLKPLVSQVSRFDRWKDPWGVIDAYRLARQEVAGLQLALVGVMTAKDDPDALEVFNSVQQYANNDPDIHLFSNPLVVGELEINAFQSGSDVIVQKSTREGFGLTVTEAMWKGTPVVGGNCGGIRLQICDGKTGFLVDDDLSCAQKIVDLLNNGELSREIGSASRESVRESYLMPRLLRDYLGLMLSLVDGKKMVPVVAATDEMLDKERYVPKSGG
jgi:trehalose synthase